MKPRHYLSVAAALAFTHSAAAQTYTWTNLAGGSWGTSGNWDATPTFGSDVILDFSTLDISANTTITLDGARTAGTLKFGDATTASNDWIVNTGTSGTLTLATTTGSPAIQVVNRVATIGAVLAGTQGFEKTGAGTLVLNNSANTITGTITVGAGVLQIRDGSTNTPAVFNNLTGKSITVKNTAILDLARLHSSSAQSVTWTLPALTLESGSTLRFRASTGTSNHTLAAAISTAGTTTINNNGGAYGQDIALTGKLSGSGTINYLATTNSGSATAAVRTLTLSNTSTDFSGNWFVDYTVTSTDDFVALRSGAGGALGTGTVTLDRRARLINNAAGGINSLSGVTLNQTTSSLQLGANAWVNTAATLTANNGTIELGTGASSIGTFVLNSTGTVTLNAGTGGELSIGTALDIRQGTLSGTGGLTSSQDLVKSTTGTAIINTNNSLSGGTTITEGTLQVGNGGTSGTIGTGNITNDGTLILNRSDARSWDQQISGSGSFTIRGGTALTLTNTHSYTGTTRIEGGSSLTLSGTGGNRLATTSSLAFAGTSALALGSNDQTVASLSLPVANADSSTTITGTGTLTINGAAPFNFGVSGTGISAVRTAAMDLTGLAGFTFDSPTQVFRVGALPGVTTSGSGRPDSSFLASNNTNITATSFLLGDQAGSGTGGNNTFRLGESTAINANTINIGASGRSNATLNFNTGLTAPKVTFRATNGTSRVNEWQVGRVAHFSNTTWTAIADFSGGELDALVDNLRIGILNTANNANRQGTQNSTFTMGKGVLDVTNLVLGEQSGTHTNNTAGGTYAANGTFTLNHADGLVVANSIRLAENTGDLTGGTRSISGTLNLQAGAIEAVEVRLGDQTATSPATITRNFNFSGGTVRNLSGNDLTITNVPINLTGTGTRIFEATTGQSITIASDAEISGSGQGFEKAGAGAMIVSSTNTYTGATMVNGGTLRAGAAAGGQAFGSNSAVTLADTAGVSLDLNDLNQTIGSLAGGGTTGGTVALGSATLTTGGNNTSTTFSGGITGAGGSLVKSGTGTFTLSGSNAFSGSVLVSNGILRLDNASALGASTEIVVENAKNPVSFNNTTLELSGGHTYGTGVTLVLRNNSTSNINNARANLTNQSGNNTWAGAIAIDGGLNQALSTAAGTLTISGNISQSSTPSPTVFLRGAAGTGIIAGNVNLGTANLTKTDGGTWEINSSGHTWANTGVAVGTLRLGIADALPTTTSLSIGQADANSATLDLNGFNQTVANLSANIGTGGTKQITSVTAATLTVNNSDNNTYTGVLAGSVALTKTNSGILTLTGNNTYTGATNLNAGTLLVNNTSGSGTGTGTVTVASGATLGGIGTLGGDIMVSGSIAPGNSIGTLNAGGNVTWNSGNAWRFELSSTDDSSDTLALAGGVFTGGDGDLFEAYEFDFMGSTPKWGETYTLVTFGSFAGFVADLDGATTNFKASNLGPGSYSTSYFTLTGGSLTFTAIPEPTSALAALLIGAGLMRRRRMKDEG